MSSCALGHQSSAYKGAEYRVPRRQPTQSDLEMDVDVDAELEEKSELQTKGVSRATDFELADYWDEVLSGRELWPVCVTLNVVRLFFRLGCVPSWRYCSAH